MTDQQTISAAERLAQYQAQTAGKGSEATGPALQAQIETTDSTSGDAKKATIAARRKWKAHYSDRQLAERFEASCATARFVTMKEYASWHLYNDSTGIWEKANEYHVRGLVQAFLKREYVEAQRAGTAMRLDEAEVCQRSQTAKRVVDWVTPTMTLSSDAFDTHRDLIVVSNGVVDLRTSELKEFDPDLFFTKRIAHPYKPGATNKYTTLALTALPEDAQDQFKIMAGQALTGHQPSRATIFFLWANGNNGKSTILDLLAATAGTYGGKPKKDVLLKGGGNSNFHTISFKGIRQAIIEELPDEGFLNGGVVRDLAGTTTMTGEHKGKDVEEFEVQATIFISFNNRPQVTETAHGVWRRLKLFRFPFTYVETKAEIRSPFHRLQNAMLKDLHKKSDDAVIAFLAWRIEGARLWYEADRTDPADAPSVAEAGRQWRSANDVLAHWFEENLAVDPASFVLVDDLLDDFNQWRNMPKAAWGKHNLVDKLTSHSLFEEHGLAYKKAARHKGLVQARWQPVNAPDWHVSRGAKAQATFVQGVRFRDATDEVTIPDDASELDAPATDDVDPYANEELF